MYVVNEGSNTVSVLQGPTVVRTIHGVSGAGFIGIAYDDATDQVYVTGSTSGKVYVYDPPVAASPNQGPASVQAINGPVLSTTHAACTGQVVSDPNFDVYDPVNHYVYVGSEDSTNLSVLSGCTLVATVALPTARGANLAGGAFDPATNRIYVSDNFLDRVYVLSGTTLVHTIKFKARSGPYGIAFDPGAGLMAVSEIGYNAASTNVSFISGYTIIGTASVGITPVSFGYDPFWDRLLVANFASNNVTSLNANDPMNPADNINIPVGSSPDGISFDYANSEDYVSDYDSNNVSVINGIGTQYGSVSIGENIYGLVWDQAKLGVYVQTLIGFTPTVYVVRGLSIVRTIDGPTNKVNFTGIAYDGATDQVFVTAIDSFDNGYVYVYS